MVMGARVGVGRVARGHITRAFGSNNAAFMTLSSSEQRIGSNYGNQQHRRQQLSPQTVLRPLSSSTQEEQSTDTSNDADIGGFYANHETYPDFASMGITSPSLLKRLSSPPLSLKRPSAVQAAVFDTISLGGNDVIVGAETGSGKTLAYLIPLVEDVLKRKREWKARMAEGEDVGKVMDPGYDYARAIILVPNKELAHQACRMAASICGGLDRCVVWGADALGMDFNHSPSNDIPEEDIVRLAILPGGLSAPQDFPPFRFATSTSPSHQRQPPPDLVFTTPANLGPMALSPKNVDLFADVSTLVVDEADMLLDGGYIRQLNNALMGFRRADRLRFKYDSISFRRKSESESEDGSDSVEESEDGSDAVEEEEVKEEPKKTQHIFVAATLPDYGLRSVDAYLNKKFPNATSITMAGMHNARHYGLEDESQTVWNEIEDNKERMQRVVDVLRLDRGEVGVDGRGLQGEKVMMFLNTVKDVDGATNGLRRAGINAVPYHAKIPMEDRTSNLDKFRRYRAPTDGEDNSKSAKDTIPVLVCTDVASRGLDIPGVTGIIELQFALNVVSHLHRMGRCGRAGNRDGRGIVFYGPKERVLVEVVREAEEQQSRMILSQDVEDESDDSEEGDEESGNKDGKVRKAFSRKRGFTKKRKKQRKRAMEETEGFVEYD
mmetsp:Transcript_6951/g.11147  ORF Transcript_6951/g.11147 Transcript_6951/m.11147 type:complete len:664 (-) Transcript_6951:98-2089(-)